MKTYRKTTYYMFSVALAFILQSFATASIAGTTDRTTNTIQQQAAKAAAAKAAAAKAAAAKAAAAKAAAAKAAAAKAAADQAAAAKAAADQAAAAKAAADQAAAKAAADQAAADQAAAQAAAAKAAADQAAAKAASKPSDSITKTVTCSSVTFPSGTNSDNAITFYFDKPYTCGTFANGDPWVTPFPEKAITIISITPESTDGFNGFEVNPTNKTKQGFDKRVYGFDATLTPPLPLEVEGDASVVKAVSVPVSSKACRPCLSHAAVLTVIAQPIENSATIFRPGYFGKSKSFVSAKNISNKSLTKIPANCCSDALSISSNQIRARYQHVQLDHLENYMGRFMHPLENMPDYGADIARDNSIYLLRMLMSDFSLTNEENKAALISYLQMAIDLRSMAANGVTWPANGGHGNGRKLPILFAGWLLGDPSFQASVIASSFSEDTQIYRSKSTGLALYGRDCGSDYAYWKSTVTGSGASDCRDPYGLIDGGGWEIGGSYQYCCTAKPWKYTALAAYILGIQSNWNYSPFFEYVERWVNHGTSAKSDTCAPYNGNANDYSISFGQLAGSGDCIQGSGRWPTKDGINKDSGLYNSLLGEQIWQWYKSQ